MRRPRSLTIMGAMSAALLGISIWSGEASATSVCYLVSSDGQSDGDVYRLDVRVQGLLTTVGEKHEFDHPLQVAYSVHGKVVPQLNLMGTATGTVIVASKEGARMGLQRNSAALGNVFSVLDCTSEEASPMPDEWPTCTAIVVRPSGIILADGISLERVDPLQEEKCSVFRDGSIR